MTAQMPLLIEKQQVTYGAQIIPYKVCYLANKTHKVAIHVYPDGSVQVDEQQKFVLKREYISGETHFYMGRRYQLKVMKNNEESVKLIRGKIIVNASDKSAEYIRLLPHENVLIMCYCMSCAICKSIIIANIFINYYINTCQTGLHARQS